MRDITLKEFFDRYKKHQKRKLEDISMLDLMKYIGEKVYVSDINRRYNAIVERIEVYEETVVFCIKEVKGGRALGNTIKRKPNKLSVPRQEKEEVDIPKKKPVKKTKSSTDSEPIIEFIAGIESFED